MLRPPTGLDHIGIVAYFSLRGFLTKSVVLSVAFICSMFSFIIICIRCSFNLIFLACEECNLTAQQFIQDEFIEQLRGKVILATDLKVQFSDIMLPLTGQFSVISISPSNVKL